MDSKKSQTRFSLDACRGNDPGREGWDKGEEE